MDLQLEGKTALVTGASAGIGRAIAKALAAEGVRVCIAARRRNLLEELAREIVAAGGTEPEIAIADFYADEAAARLAQEARQRLGRIDILVNAAGGAVDAPDKWLNAPEKAWIQALTLNYTQIRQLTLAVIPGMIEQQWGRVINVTGKAEPGQLNGTTPAKVAVHGFMKGLSREVARHGITVNSIPPGQFVTEQTQRRHTDEQRRHFVEREIPIGRYGKPEELAYLAVVLASPRACYITGNVMHVDGGQHRFALS